MYLTSSNGASGLNNYPSQMYNNSNSNNKNSNSNNRRMESEGSAEDKHNMLLRQPSVKYEHDLGQVIEKMEQEVGSAVTASQLKDLRDIVSRCGDAMSVSMFEEFLGRVYNELKDAKEET